MKRFINIFSAVAAFFALYACQAELPPIVINPYPVFDINGTYTVNTISIYDTDETTITVSRVYGLSKEVELTVDVDEDLLAEYNTLNNTSYQVMPENCYSFPTSVKLEKTVKSIQVPVVIKPEALVAAVGYENVSNYVLPISILDSSIELDDKGSYTEVILIPSLSKPSIEVEVPVEVSSLEFISAIPLTQTVQLKANSNFSTLDPTKVSYEAKESYVATFNAANGTSHKFLPIDRIDIKVSEFDNENMVLTTSVEFDCASIGGDDTYICPLVINSTSNDYVLRQSEPVYVIVSMSQLRIWIPEAQNTMLTTSGKGALTFKMNSPMMDDQDIALVYDAAKVAEYNAANGTSYKTFAQDAVALTTSKIPAGVQESTVNFDLDLSNLEFDNKDTLLVALSINESVLKEGTLVDPALSTVYMKVYRTLCGVYEEEDTKSGYDGRDKTVLGGNSDFKPVIYVADGVTTVPHAPSGLATYLAPSQKGTQKYGAYYCKYLYCYFDVDWANELEGKPGCYPLINLIDREGQDAIIWNASYYDVPNGTFIFDFVTLGYWGPGGGGGAGLDPGTTQPGEVWHTKLYNRY